MMLRRHCVQVDIRLNPSEYSSSASSHMLCRLHMQARVCSQSNSLDSEDSLVYVILSMMGAFTPAYSLTLLEPFLLQDFLQDQICKPAPKHPPSHQLNCNLWPLSRRPFQPSFMATVNFEIRTGQRVYILSSAGDHGWSTVPGRGIAITAEINCEKCTIMTSLPPTVATLESKRLAVGSVVPSP